MGSNDNGSSHSRRFENIREKRALVWALDGSLRLAGPWLARPEAWLTTQIPSQPQEYQLRSRPGPGTWSVVACITTKLTEAVERRGHGLSKATIELWVPVASSSFFLNFSSSSSRLLPRWWWRPPKAVAFSQDGGDLSRRWRSSLLVFSGGDPISHGGGELKTAELLEDGVMAVLLGLSACAAVVCCCCLHSVG
jgi:hypothetical protein